MKHFIDRLFDLLEAEPRLVPIGLITAMVVAAVVCAAAGTFMEMNK